MLYLNLPKEHSPPYCDCIRGNKGTLEPELYSIAEKSYVSNLNAFLTFS